MNLEVAKSKIKPLDGEAMELAQKRLDSLTKPLGSLGVLEGLAKKLAGITGNPQPEIGKKTIIVMAGDHGVVEEGVSAFPQEVTPQMVYNFLNGGAGINVLAKHVGADVKVVDIGVAAPLEVSGLISRKIKMGTDNMTEGPAMSKDEAVAAIEAGIDVAEKEINEGVTILGTGEMGIGNTTPSSAITAVFGDISVEEVVGKGTGIDDDGLNQKINIIKKAIQINRPDPTDAIDVLAKVGGLEIAGLAGVILGAAANQIPVVIDGFISGAAALVASKIAPESVNYMI
ncbi:MAG TPA: nicotinate-nucleotide--dimethylbenzimidazole phosphoribosyltransferase, partial [Actinobacteria bacterium]|nr:nicotinate-nucleotide--dimethylbenzimidazole phosphoribosyltransferase [Actinomycetota bacterium]